MTENPILVKTFQFALRIVKLCKILRETHKEFTMSHELLAAGTRIGRDVKAALSGEGRESFTKNMALALQKSDEVEYWLELIHFAELLNEKEFASIERDRKEIASMLNRIVQTSKNDA